MALWSDSASDVLRLAGLRDLGGDLATGDARELRARRLLRRGVVGRDGRSLRDRREDGLHEFELQLVHRQDRPLFGVGLVDLAVVQVQVVQATAPDRLHRLVGEHDLVTALDEVCGEPHRSIACGARAIHVEVGRHLLRVEPSIELVRLEEERCERVVRREHGRGAGERDFLQRIAQRLEGGIADLLLHRGGEELRARVVSDLGLVRRDLVCEIFHDRIAERSLRESRYRRGDQPRHHEHRRGRDCAADQRDHRGRGHRPALLLPLRQIGDRLAVAIGRFAIGACSRSLRGLRVGVGEIRRRETLEGVEHRALVVRRQITRGVGVLVEECETQRVVGVLRRGARRGGVDRAPDAAHDERPQDRIERGRRNGGRLGQADFGGLGEDLQGRKLDQALGC